MYGFLDGLKTREQIEKEEALARSMDNKSQLSDRARSLEDILHNLKKYRTKFSENNRCSRCRPNCNDNDNENGLAAKRPGGARSATRLSRRNNNKDQSTSTSLDKESQFRAMESSTWRVMRHLRSADIRNKFPLPQANPDYHFRNSTVFVTAGRPPKATFLLHPDWV